MMEIRGQAVDALSKQPLPYATITVVDDEGNSTGVAVSADSAGKFQMVTNGGAVVITYAGFQPTLVSTADLISGGYPVIEIQLGSDLSPVTVTAHKKTNYWPWAIAAAIAYYALK